MARMKHANTGPSRAAFAAAQRGERAPCTGFCDAAPASPYARGACPCACARCDSREPRVPRGMLGITAASSGSGFPSKPRAPRRMLGICPLAFPAAGSMEVGLHLCSICYSINITDDRKEVNDCAPATCGRASARRPTARDHPRAYVRAGGCAWIQERERSVPWMQRARELPPCFR